jgi:ornithine lipid ester-linked acyl 2-hydroxylase
MSRGKVQGQPLAPPPSGLPGKIAVKFLDFAEWCFAKFSRIPDRPVFRREEFPWVPAVEADFPAIRRELEAVLERRDELPNFQDISGEVRLIQSDNNWKTFMFCGYGVWAEENCKRCPATVAALKKIPGMKTGFFSILAPQKHIPPHRGPYNGVLRLHLGLMVPEPRDRVRIRVDDQICTWEEGRALLFDDSYNHEVWNDTGGWRVVLFVDFVRPVWFPFNILNWFILRAAVFTSFIREANDNQNKWEKEFYRKAQEMRANRGTL